jgi:hypothetical protein
MIFALLNWATHLAFQSARCLACRQMKLALCSMRICSRKRIEYNPRFPKQASINQGANLATQPDLTANVIFFRRGKTAAGLRRCLFSFW